ncbi:MAG: hypothetical protein IJ391_05430 [Clostridia bacterium]|nr:hypothetical protein [Clostridia bacterium]
MLKISALILACVTAVSAFSAGFAPSTYTELGIPSSQRYAEGIRARGVWDMAYVDGSLFIGSGDFDNNAGPVDIWCYDTYTGKWTNSGTVNDEEVNKFVTVDGKLCVPGTDPRINGTTYYSYNSGTWETHDIISEATHTFDILEHDNKIFAGLGVSAGQYPIAVSSDCGKSFKSVKMMRDGRPLDTSAGSVVRVYDLFCLKDTVYAVFRYRVGDVKSFDLYRYEDGEFVFDNAWYDKLEVEKYVSGFIGGDAVYKDKLWFTTGNLFVTDDMENLTKIALDEKMGVYDVYASEDALYALGCETMADGRYRISVWENTSGETDGFAETAYFYYDAPAVSLVRADGIFFIGTGDINNVNDKSGSVLAIAE